ncbi:MAG: hypothetical protein C4558_09065 [Dehalococcoidia bacterium]|nr:MAG: hypothetical protein C4558_09065 [Dehalococcoidia bacterium]
MVEHDTQQPARPRSLSRDARRRLRQPLDGLLVAERTNDAGEIVRYLEGWRAIEQANAVFGVDRWGAEVIGEVVYRAVPTTGRGRSAPCGVYTATVRVTVDGCQPHSDVGVGAVEEQNAEAHATAYKSAVTDALKRALRHFGDQFGNRLSAGVEDAAIGAATSEHAPDELRRQVIAIAADAGTDEAQIRSWVTQRYGRPLDDLDVRSLLHAVRACSRALERRHEQAQAA